MQGGSLRRIIWRPPPWATAPPSRTKKRYDTLGRHADLQQVEAVLTACKIKGGRNSKPLPTPMDALPARRLLRRLVAMAKTRTIRLGQYAATPQPACQWLGYNWLLILLSPCSVVSTALETRHHATAQGEHH